MLGENHFSSLMRSSWETGSMWLNYAAIHPDQVDTLYYEVLKKYHPKGVEPVLPHEEQKDMDAYIEHATGQAAAYEDAWDVRLRGAVL